MEKKLSCFLVVGRMGKSLVSSKAEPFVLHPSIQQIYIFSEKEGFPLSKTFYITLPRWIAAIKPRFLSRFIRIFAEPIQLIYHAIKIRPAIINGYHIIPKGINSLIAARLSGSKCIMSLIGGIVEIETYSRLRWFLKRLNMRALKAADLVTTKGTVVNSYLEKKSLPPSKILIYNGSINLDKFHVNPLVSRDTDVLFAGTFRNLKGPDRVIQMLLLLKTDFPKIKACFVGDGYLYNYCTDQVKTLGLSENVLFTGQVDNPAQYYQRSRVLVMPSRSEGLPTSMLEAMVCGCVPVVSNVGNIRDAAIHGENAFLVEDYQDIETFVKYISMLLSDENLRSGMAQKGVTTVTENYSANRQAEIVDRMIQKLFPGHVAV